MQSLQQKQSPQTMTQPWIRGKRGSGGDPSRNPPPLSNFIQPNVQKEVQHFEPTFNHRNLNAQADELALGDWCGSANSLDRQIKSKKLQPKVTFSEKSIMFVYNSDPHYARSKSYSRAERADFSSELLTEAKRIKRLILSTPGASPKDSFKYLIKEKTISLDEIVGIEHLVFSKSAAKLLKNRKEHAKAVLTEQRMQLSKKEQDDHAAKLGEFAASRSRKSLKRARIRAAMAA